MVITLDYNYTAHERDMKNNTGGYRTMLSLYTRLGIIRI